ncbi:formyltetrahydrofolate deformylase [Galactobacter sp.]|uniref:formyltetrahydrofolate deformylase n=1 Tax=Galactobacter sp. TaxID=2676125 RepID=UPI0025C1641F|nr:formyltetrahydrofolate deformylase [Galactobacter sp.]
MSETQYARKNHGTLIVSGPDQPGLVAGITNLITEAGGNIVSLDQYTTDPQEGSFYQRVVFHRRDLAAAIPDIEASLRRFLEPLGMKFRLTNANVPKRMAILASKSDHCLLDLLWRHRRNELPATVPMVISNHTDVVDDVRSFNIPFFHVPSVAGPDKKESEDKIIELLKGNVDFVVLARYMQVLSDDFLDRVGVPVINIHHSFLPAFIGAGPYRKAKERGVKLIGATAHYVTADLDEGPIIEQDVARVDHSMTANDMQARGAYVEREVLSRAVTWHAEDRVIRDGNHTIVFN